MYKPKTCPICGEIFTPKSARQKYCNKPVIRRCVVCGNEYGSNCTLTYAKCCSRDCTTKYAHQQSVSSYSTTTKVCVLCGKEFIPKNNTQQICSDRHFRACVICGKSFEINWKPGRNIDDIAKTCSSECKTKASFINGNPFQNEACREKAKQTVRERYGVDHPMQSAEVKDKVNATNMDRYGVKRFTQTPAYIDKAKATNQEKYGTDWARQNPEIQKKSENTLFEHYGVTNPMQSDEFKAKSRETYKAHTGYDSPMRNPDVIQRIKDSNLDKYGVEYALQDPTIRQKAEDTMVARYGVSHALQSGDIIAKVRETNKQRYGYDNPAKSPVVKTKISDTMLKRYGVAHYNESWDYRKSTTTNPDKVNEWRAFLDDPEEYVKLHFDHKPNYQELENVLGVNSTTIWVHLNRADKLDVIQYTLSYLENEIVDILRGIKTDIKIVQHERQLIKPYELDIYLPEYSLGIEVNPTSTHNSTLGSHGNAAKSPNYHRMKTELCEEHGIFLFHIFGYDWHHKKEIIVSMLRNLIHGNTKKIYARNCELREVPTKSAYDFLYANHRQGGVYSKIRYGLYYNDELVSLMTFGKLRNTLGLGNEDLSDCWELVRFCNKINISVIGGASKLFKHFIKTINPARIRSFSDRAHTKGTLYSTLGFQAIRCGEENYMWVNLLDNKAYNRVNAQKHNLRKFFHDDTIDLSKTEREIMESHGYVQVYDSGTITWEWQANRYNK